MDIVACTDNHFIMPTGVMMHSICVNNVEEPITFHIVIDEKVTNSQKEALQTTIQCFHNKAIAFYCIDGGKYVKLPANPTITQATYYRLNLAEILPERIDKVLYLDGDVICRKSLVSLWNTDISQCAVAGGPDASETAFEKENHLHLQHWNGYFNAGVLLINLRWWREHHSTEAFYSFINEHRDWLRCQNQP